MTVSRRHVVRVARRTRRCLVLVLIFVERDAHGVVVVVVLVVRLQATAELVFRGGRRLPAQRALAAGLADGCLERRRRRGERRERRVPRDPLRREDVILTRFERVVDRLEPATAVREEHVGADARVDAGVERVGLIGVARRDVDVEVARLGEREEFLERCDGRDVELRETSRQIDHEMPQRRLLLGASDHRVDELVRRAEEHVADQVDDEDRVTLLGEDSQRRRRALDGRSDLVGSRLRRRDDRSLREPTRDADQRQHEAERDGLEQVRDDGEDDDRAERHGVEDVEVAAARDSDRRQPYARAFGRRPRRRELELRSQRVD
mmetsp:Transcript_25965/g.103828  ORF Transcript_25965/g.103828 Transcript_25965/m.103828 type:complete len:321 (+) Transcript_25965:1657-2619(+)